MEEYMMLRNEIMDKLKFQEDLTQFCYTIIASIWALTFTVKVPYISLIALFIIVPISLRKYKVRKDTMYISAYMIVYLENEIDIKWERNNSLYKNKNATKFSNRIIEIFSKCDFIFSSLLTVVIFWSMYYVQNHTLIIEGSWVLTGLLFFVQIILIGIESLLILFFINYDKERMKYIEKWGKTLKETNNMCFDFYKFVV